MKIGVFDSGYGGLTILEKIRQALPDYDYIYLGDNARAPYGTHSFDVIYKYTLQAVRYLLNQDCALVILACNTASARALRTIQQCDLPTIRNGKDVPNVLGVIRPTVEVASQLTKTRHIGVLGTPATVSSESYVIELTHQADDLIVSQLACPMWVPLIESNEHIASGADFFVDKYLGQIMANDPQIDTLILGCTHYPLLLPKIHQWMNNKYADVRLVSQGEIVAKSLVDYLKRHVSIADSLTCGASCEFLTTENAEKFSESASVFLSTPVQATHIEL